MNIESLNLSTRYIAQVGIIASLYAALTIVLAPISYGPLQVRISEALTILPFLTPAAVPGLFIGCVVANVYGGLGIYDIIGGSLCTLLAAYLTYLLSKTKQPLLAPLPPVVVNALGVSLYLHFLFQLPYWLTVAYIALGEIIACFVLGYPLLLIILKREKLGRIFKL
ncbi:MAG TPA: QueT transporter family protein [candidate division Zixibacteria bacterium]